MPLHLHPAADCSSAFFSPQTLRAGRRENVTFLMQAGIDFLHFLSHTFRSSIVRPRLTIARLHEGESTRARAFPTTGRRLRCLWFKCNPTPTHVVGTLNQSLNPKLNCQSGLHTS